MISSNSKLVLKLVYGDGVREDTLGRYFGMMYVEYLDYWLAEITDILIAEIRKRDLILSYLIDQVLFILVEKLPSKVSEVA